MVEPSFSRARVILPDHPERIPEASLPKISTPTLVFWSENNPGTGPEVGRRIDDAIPGAKYYCMADAAHWPQWERAEEHDRVVLDFLAGRALPESTYREIATSV